MMSRCVTYLIVSGVFVVVSATSCLAQQSQVARILNELRSDEPELVSAALKLIETFDGDASQLVTELTAIIKADEYATTEVALRGLARMQSKAKASIPVLCQKLGDRRYWIRSGAVATLVAIGDDSVAPVRELLQAPSGAVRPAATEVLVRLARVTLIDVEQLTKDADPRVRAAVARGCSQVGKPGVGPLVNLLADPEIAVSVQAARALRANRADLPVAISGLTLAMARPEVRPFAGKALASYGIAAQRAIPAIINSFAEDPEKIGFYFYDGATVALQHIGPPHELDIPVLCECLKHPHPAAASLAADSLGLMGTKGQASATALAAAHTAALEKFLVRKRALKPDSSGVIAHDDSWPFHELAERCAAALWRVSGDSQRFLEMTEALCLKSESALWPDRSSPWSELPADAFPYVEKMLKMPDTHVRLTVLRGLAHLGVKGAPLKHAVLELTGVKEDELSKLARRVLADMGPAAADVAGPKLLADLRKGNVALWDFAYGAMHLELRSPEVLHVLETGLTNEKQATIEMCAEALCKLTDEPLRISRLVIATEETRPLSRRAAIIALRNLKSPDEVVIRYCVADLAIPATCRDALTSLGRMGEAARPALPEIEKYLVSEDLMVRRTAAQAIFFIDKNAEPLEKQLKESFMTEPTVRAESQELSTFEDDTPFDHGTRWVGLNMIAECQAAGAPFLDYVVSELRRPESRLATTAVETLQAIGTPEAVVALEEAAQSTDWEVRSAATRAIRKLRAILATNK